MALFRRAPALDALAASDRVAAGTVLVVDVRQPAEWSTGHIRGAVHIPLAQLPSRLDRIPSGTTILTVCRSGHRSSSAAATLRRAGHEVLNLRGGLTAWTRAGLPLERDPRRRR